MSATSLPAFLDAFTAALQLRAGLAGVNIYGCPVAPEDLGAAGIELADEVAVATERVAMSSDDMEETYTVEGSITVLHPYHPAAGRVAGINAAAKAARDACEAIMHEVAGALADDATAGGSVDDAALVSQTYSQGMAPEAQMGRLCWCRFSIEVQNHLTP